MSGTTRSQRRTIVSSRRRDQRRFAIDGFLVAAHEFDVPGMERILDESFAAQRFESAMDEIVFPALRGIGDAWSAGEIDVAVEHAASETIRRRLARFFDAAGRGDRSRR